MIVVVGGIKGGSGKTTIATNLTVIRSSKGKKVLLVDADKQKTTTQWHLQRELENIDCSWTTIQLSGLAVKSQITKMKEDYDDIIVDVGGSDTGTQRSILTIANVYLMPFQPKSFDIWTLEFIEEILSEVSEINPKLISYAIINRGDYTGNDNNVSQEILKKCSYITCLPVVIGQRKAFCNASTNGCGVVEMKNQDRKAIYEINSLYDHIYKND